MDRFLQKYSIEFLNSAEMIKSVRMSVLYWNFDTLLILYLRAAYISSVVRNLIQVVPVNLLCNEKKDGAASYKKNNSEMFSTKISFYFLFFGQICDRYFS